jgi:DNA-3-methyladenine glycosylase I
MFKRCEWPGGDSRMLKYHDEEWGVPVHSDKKLFEYLLLDSFQAGLSWQTILNKRENFKKAFDTFDVKKIAKYDKTKKARLMRDKGIIRNRLKIDSAVDNAKAFLEIQKEFGSFNMYVWQFVGNKPKQNRFKNMSDIPAISKESDALSKDLKKRGFRFVGSTIIYAFMQGAGLVNDHTVYCFRHKEV